MLRSKVIFNYSYTAIHLNWPHLIWHGESFVVHINCSNSPNRPSLDACLVTTVIKNLVRGVLSFIGCMGIVASTGEVRVAATQASRATSLASWSLVLQVHSCLVFHVLGRIGVHYDLGGTKSLLLAKWDMLELMHM